MSAVLVEQPTPEIALVRLNRPEARNALDQETRGQLAQHFDRLGRSGEVANLHVNLRWRSWFEWAARSRALRCRAQAP